MSKTWKEISMYEAVGVLALVEILDVLHYVHDLIKDSDFWEVSCKQNTYTGIYISTFTNKKTGISFRAKSDVLEQAITLVAYPFVNKSIHKRFLRDNEEDYYTLVEDYEYHSDKVGYCDEADYTPEQYLHYFIGKHGLQDDVEFYKEPNLEFNIENILELQAPLVEEIRNKRLTNAKKQGTISQIDENTNIEELFKWNRI